MSNKLSPCLPWHKRWGSTHESSTRTLRLRLDRFGATVGHLFLVVSITHDTLNPYHELIPSGHCAAELRICNPPLLVSQQKFHLRRLNHPFYLIRGGYDHVAFMYLQVSRAT